MEKYKEWIKLHPYLKDRRFDLYNYLNNPLQNQEKQNDHDEKKDDVQ